MKHPSIPLAIILVTATVGCLAPLRAQASVLVPQTAQWDALSSTSMSSSQSPNGGDEQDENYPESLRIPVSNGLSSDSKGSISVVANGGMSAIVVSLDRNSDETRASLLSAETHVVVEGPGDRLFRPPRLNGDR